MNITRTTGWSLATGGLCVALTAASWFLLIDPERAAAADAREATVAAQAQNQELEIRIDQLEQEFADLPTRQAELAAIRQALPEEPALAQLVRDVEERADDSQVVLDALVSGTPTTVVDPAAATVGAPAEPATSGGAPTGEPSVEPSTTPSEEPSASPSSAPASDTAAPAPAGAATAAPAGPVLAAIPVTVTTTGDFAGTTLFLKDVQADLPRAFLVDGLTLTVLEGEDIEPGTVQSVITGRVFVFKDPGAIDLDAAVTDSPTPSNG